MKKYYIKAKEWLTSHLERREGFNPQRDWKIIFSVFILLFIISIAFNGFLFLQLRDGKIFKSGVDIPEYEKLIDEERLDETLEYFDGRQERFNAIRRSGVSSFDPSL